MMRGMMGHGIAPYTLNPNAYLLLTLVGVSTVVVMYLVSKSVIPKTIEESNEEDLHSQSKEVGNGLDVLEVLPEDERRILTPVLETPGLTQVELRGRSDFSKSKVSQVVTTLEKRGLLYREPQGRTYRIYPGEMAKQHLAHRVERPVREDS